MVEVTINISGRKIRNMEDFKNAFRELKDGKYLITIKSIRKRSLQQNAYYWGVVVPLVRKGLFDNGFDEVKKNEDAHEVLKAVFLKKDVVSKQTGEIITTVGRSTTELDVPEMGDFIERVCRWSADYLGVVIPSPNDEFAMFNDYVNKVSNEVSADEDSY